MPDYVNHQFECFISPENVRGVKKLDDSVKSIIRQSAQVLNQDANMEKSQQKILDVLGPVSRF